MKKLVVLVWLMQLGLCTLCAHAQTNQGHDFWLGFMPNYLMPATVTELLVSSQTKNKVTIELYGGGTGTPSQTIVQNLIANQSVTVHLDVAKSESWTLEQPAYRGIHVTSTAPCTVAGYSTTSGSADGFLALPVSLTGTKYYTANFYDDNYGIPADPLPGEFLIIGEYDNTNVTIRANAKTRLDPQSKITGHQEGETWSVALNKGQTYLVQSSGTDVGASDLTGSLITSSKPVGVLTGHLRCSVPVGAPTNTKDHLIEYLPPVDNWGTEYFELPMLERTSCGNYVRLLSAEDQNHIQVNSGATITLNEGEFADRTLVRATERYHSTNGEKFLAIEYAYSSYFNGDPIAADPYMSILPSVSTFCTSAAFASVGEASGSSPAKNYLTIVADSNAIAGVMLNEKPLNSYIQIAAAKFTGSPYAASRISLSSDEKSYVIKSAKPFGAWLYGYSDIIGYGFPVALSNAGRYTSDDTPPFVDATSDLGCGSVVFTARDSGSGVDYAMLRDSSAAWPRTSQNYALSTTRAELSDTLQVSLTVIDPLLDAYAAVLIADRAGHDTTVVFSYAAKLPVLTIDGSTFSTLSLGSIPIAFDTCVNIQVSNPASTPLELQLAHKHLKGGDVITMVDRLTLQAKESKPFSICLNTSDTNAVLDSVILAADCYRIHFALTASPATGILKANFVDFRTVHITDTACSNLRVRNVGNGVLRITGWQWIEGDSNAFYFPVSPIGMTIPPSSFKDIRVCVSSGTPGAMSAQIRFLTDTRGIYRTSEENTSNFRVSFYGQSAVSTSGLATHEFTMSPNPVASGGVIQISSLPLDVSTISVQLLDVLGREVLHTMSHISDRDNGMLALPTLGTGNYVVRITIDGQTSSKMLRVK